MSEDLTMWEPKRNVEYNGYDKHVRHKGHKKHIIAHSIIYYKKRDNSLEEHYGGFNIIDNQVKVWYNDYNGQKVQKFIPIPKCKFSKTRQGNTIYYHVVVETDLGGSVENMNNEENMDEKEFGIKQKNLDPVKFGARKDASGLWSKVTGKASAIYNKQKYEEKLDELWKSFDFAVKEIDSQEKELEATRVKIPALEKTVTTAEKEWSESLKSLGNLINKKTTHEKGMWEITQKARQNKAMKVKQKFKESDIDEMNFNSIMDYIKQYPELQSTKDIDNGTQAIKEKRNEKITAQKELDDTKTKYNFLLNTFESLTERAEAYINEFDKLIPEADEKVNNSKYNKSSLFGVLKTDFEKDSTRLNLMPYKGKLEDRKILLKRVNDKLSLFKRKKWVDVEF